MQEPLQELDSEEEDWSGSDMSCDFTAQVICCVEGIIIYYPWNSNHH